MVTSPESPPADVPDGNPHYVRDVTALGDERNVVVQEDIYASNGMKLLAKGVSINRDQFERLTRHKLKQPLDLLLMTDQPVDATLLAQESAQLLDQDPTLLRMATRAGDVLALKHGLGALALPPPLAFRLTVLRERRPELYRHSLRTTLIAQAMALHLHLTLRDQETLLLAALCHDLGEMHTDPALLAPGYRVPPGERRFIHVHPVTGHVLLRQLGLPSVASMKAVLHHHERQDGSGYPYGLTGERIHPLAKLIGLADVAETVLRRADPQRLDVLIRLNRSRFDPAVIDALYDLARGAPGDAAAVPADPAALRPFACVIEALRAWQVLRQTPALSSGGAGDALPFVHERMLELRSLLLQAGFDPDDIETTLDLAQEDPVLLGELRLALDELRWRLSDIANEIERRAPSSAAPMPTAWVDWLARLRQIGTTLEAGH